MQNIHVYATAVGTKLGPPFWGNFAFFVMQVFKRHNPSTAEEQEMMENLFDSLCSCLMLSSNRDRFLKGEGLQLMNLMLRYPDNFVILLSAFDTSTRILAGYLWVSVYKISVLVYLSVFSFFQHVSQTLSDEQAPLFVFSFVS